MRRRRSVTPTPPATNDGVVTPRVLGRAFAAVYGVVAYVSFLAVTLCTIAFLANIGLSRTVDRGPHRSGTAAAVAIDTALLGLFAVQHSAMARPWFKRRWTRPVPPAYERSTYVVAASAVLALVLWQWRPIDSVVWAIHGEGAVVLWAWYGLGWFVVVFSTFLIDHFELFGLRQVYLHARALPNWDRGFRAPLLYRFVRHPIMVGFLIVFWAAPTMTVGHLMFSALASAYIVVAVRFEERDLCRELPEYRAYQASTARFVPRRLSRPATNLSRHH
jgi:protein-S-isoprenylcysteine O-methyltransferase Ste14